ncbi:MAG: phosphoribosylamine--glycine ligase [Chloroflexi bacterium]|nr:phosphoribosylamine--glycine ligase [Chloroflexota bacterium]
MKILVVGSGAREHAIAWRLTAEGAIVSVAPGNGGTPGNVPLHALDVAALAEFALRERIDLTIAGPEGPLAAGLVDRFGERGLKAFGPTRDAARLEWSKAWTKDFLRRHSIPTGAAEVVDSEAAARRAIARVGVPVVLKADGLAGGKGVFVVTSTTEVDGMLAQLFGLGEAASTVLVEEYLEGPELSVLAFTDGLNLAAMPPARDYKRLHDGDRGPNTGGMGGYTWPTYATAALLEEVDQRVLRPTLAGMRSEGHPYRGVLYAGLMLTRDGPKVIEFNCRFGDPECQLILPLLRSGLGDICASVAEAALDPGQVQWREGRTFGVVLAARGYPEAPESGDPIAGLDQLPEAVVAFHAGTRVDEVGNVVTAGGRVLTVVGSERDAVYAAADRLSFDGKQFRRDIGTEVQALVGAAR